MCDGRIFDRSTIGGMQDELKCRAEEHIANSDPDVVTESDAMAIRQFVDYACMMYCVSFPE